MHDAPADVADRVAEAHRPGVVAQEESPVDERRRHERFRFKSQVPVVWFTREHVLKVVNVRTSDISVGSVRLIGRAVLRPGLRGAMEMHKSDGARALVGLEVRHCSYVGKMHYAYGCVFAALSPQLIKSWFTDANGRVLTLAPGMEIVPNQSADPDELVDPYDDDAV